MRTGFATSVIGALLCLTSCYSAGDGDSGNAGSGGASQGGSGGFGALAGSGGGGDGAPCRSSNDCGSSTSSYFTCVPPGATPPQSNGCGAPDWCGDCICGPAPQAPYGTGQQCGETMACPTAETMPGLESYASLCGMDAQCTACEVDDDCPADAPRCSAGRTGFGTECFECLDAMDCPAERPYCTPLQGSGFTYVGGACRECQSTSDCAIGLCVDGSCQPQCETSEVCANEFLYCSAVKRCEPPPCTSATECPPFGECVDGGCRRLSCTSDSECGGGSCVNGACYSGPGECFEQFAYP